MVELTNPGRLATPHRQASSEASTARFDLPAEGFALASLFERVPGARVDLDPTIANPDAHALVVVRTDGHEHAVDTALRSAPGVGAVERFGERTAGWTYRVTWEGRPRRLIQRLVAADVTLLSAQGQSGQWKFRLLAPDREGISQADDILDDLDCAAECRSISTFEGEGRTRSGLTDEQREALIEAFELGYYNIPRDVTAEELADHLGISHQALSERFRRAYRQLIETELVVSEENTVEKMIYQT